MDKTTEYDATSQELSMGAERRQGEDESEAMNEGFEGETDAETKRIMREYTPAQLMEMARRSEAVRQHELFVEFKKSALEKTIRPEDVLGWAAREGHFDLMGLVRRLVSEGHLRKELGALAAWATAEGLLVGAGEVRAAGPSSEEPVYYNPDDPREKPYGGTGPQPAWLQAKLGAGHHIFEFRPDRPLEGYVWEDSEGDGEPWRGRGPMPEWLNNKMHWGDRRRPWDHVVKWARKE